MADTNPQTSKPGNDQASASEAVHQSTQAARQGGQASSEALRRAGEVSAEATQRGSQAASEFVQRAGDASSETMRRGAEALADTQRQLAKQAADRFAEVSRKVAEATQGTTENVRAFMTLPNAAKGGLQDLQQSVTGLVEGVVRTNLRATQELFQLANPSALVELQQRFVREYLDALMQGTATLVRATRRTADETLRPLEQQIEQRQSANRNQGFQQAAE
jgi:hypothetical protein